MSDKITRVEVIDENGRVYTKWNCSVELSYQDNNRTLKLFVTPNTQQQTKMTTEQGNEIAHAFYNTGLTLEQIAKKYNIKEGSIHDICKKHKSEQNKKNFTGVLLINPKDLEIAMNILAEYSIDFEQPKKCELNIFYESKLNFTNFEK